MTVSGTDWHDIGIQLANQVSEKSCFAYRFDRAIHEDDVAIQDLWRLSLAPKAEQSMKLNTPLAYQLCSGFDTVFRTKGDGFSVWELLTLYEVDMFLHEFHYKCRYCKGRVMQTPRYVCSTCHPDSTGSDKEESPVEKKKAPRVTKAKKQKRVEDFSVCSGCITVNPRCEECSSALNPTTVLHETEGLGIANKSGCTGFGYRDAQKYLCGQTLEMSTDTYNYGRFDTIYRLENTGTKHTVLVYDVGCILSPFGINSKQVGLCVFNLYNSDYALPPYTDKEDRVPMAALQWEILLGNLVNIPDIVKFLRHGGRGIQTFTSASFILASPTNCDTQVIEISANEHWVPPVDPSDTEDNHSAAVLQLGDGQKCIVRANNCLAGSSLHGTESLPPNISSAERQKDLTSSCRNSAGVNSEWAKDALSTATIQTAYCLGTIIMEPRDLRIHVRFRVGTRISSTLKDGGKWETFTV